MKKFLSLLTGIIFSFTSLYSQTNNLKFNIKSGAESVKIVYRLNAVNAKAEIDFGNNEKVTLEQKTADELITLEHTFTEVSSTDREMSIVADNIVVLRIVSSKVVNQVISLSSPTLETLNLDYTKISKSPHLDFTKCPKLKVITLNECEVERVTFADENNVENFQISPPLFSEKTLKELDFSKLKNIKTLGLNGVAIPTIDLTYCPKLEKLVVKGLTKKIHPTAILGAKKLKNLTFVNIQMCGLGYDMLPDLNKIDQKNYIIKNILSFPVPKDKVKDLVVDLSYLDNQKGIAETPQKTIYKWKYYDKNQKKLFDLAKDKYKEKDGVFTFDSSILNEDGSLNIRCYPFNPGFNSLEKFAFYYKSGYATKYIKINAPKPMAEFTITSESPGNDEDGYPIEEIDVTMHLGVSKTTPIKIDWGDGPNDYTVNAGEPQKVLKTVDLGAKIKIYGDIEHLDASSCKIVKVEFNKPKALKVLRLSTNKIETIDLKELTGLTELSLTNNNLSEIDLSSLTELDELYCGYNNFTKLDISKNIKLTLLNCNNNKLSNVDFSLLTKLQILTISDNLIQDAEGNNTLDLTKNKELVSLDVSNCQLKEVKIDSKNLKRLVLYNNKLDVVPLEMGVSYPDLYYLDLRKNNISACTINDILYILPNNPESIVTAKPMLFLKDNLGATTYDQELLNNKTWVVDVEGDGTGCSTIKLFDVTKEEEKAKGTVVVIKEEQEVAFGTPIEKGSEIIFKVNPKEGYALKEIKIDEEILTNGNADKTLFNYTANKTANITYQFETATNIESDFANTFIIRMDGNVVNIEGLQNEKNVFYLYNIQGKLIKKGMGNNHSVQLNIDNSGIYIVKIGNETIRIVR